MVEPSQLSADQPVERQLFAPLVADDPRVAVLSQQMAELVTYVQALGPTHAAVPQLQAQLNQVTEEVQHAFRSLEHTVRDHVLTSETSKADVLPHLRFLSEVCAQAVANQASSNSLLTENLGQTQNALRQLTSTVERTTSPVADSSVPQHLASLAELCNRTLAMHSEGQRFLSASLSQTNEALQRLVSEVRKPLPTPVPAVDYTLIVQLQALTELCSRSVQAQTLGQQMLAENLGHTHAAIRQLAADSTQATSSPSPASSPSSDRNGRDPKLPPYDGGNPPDQWFRTIADLFLANGTDAHRQFLWAKCALRGAARDFLTFECGDISDLQGLSQALERRFRPFTTQYQLHTELSHLRMRAGDFSGYLRKFNTLRNQLNPALVEPAVTFAFTRGLTPDFEQEVLYPPHGH